MDHRAWHFAETLLGLVVLTVPAWRRVNPNKVPPDQQGSDGIRTDGLKGPLDGRSVGRGVHQVIQALLEIGLRTPSPTELFASVAAHPLAQHALTYKLAARQRLVTLASCYFNTPSFARPGWVLLATEAPTGAGDFFDAVWQTPDDRIVVEEIKSNRDIDAEDPALLDQVRRYATAAEQKWGDRFAGVRVLILTAPRSSFWLDRSGKITLMVCGS
jgi:hypothetical protein